MRSMASRRERPRLIPGPGPGTAMTRQDRRYEQAQFCESGTGMRFGATTRTLCFLPLDVTTSLVVPSLWPITVPVSMDCGPMPDDSLLAVGAAAALSAAA